MANELSGIRSGDGAKMKAEVGEDSVEFRGAYKGSVPFEEIVAEARGTLLVLSFKGLVVELAAGSRASQLAARIRSPPSRMDRMGIQHGTTAAVAGPLDAGLRSELGTRASVAPGVPKEPVDALLFAVRTAADLASLPKLVPLVALTGALWVVSPSGAGPSESQVVAAGKAAGLKLVGTVRLGSAGTATKLARP